MHCDHKRYFIELQPASASAPGSRHGETAIRRAQAERFISSIYDWLKDHELDDKVSDMDVTAFGQVRITCEDDVIARIRDEDELHIAAIRPGAMFVEGMKRYQGSGVRK